MYIAQLVYLNSFTTKIIIKNKKLVKNERKKNVNGWFLLEKLN